MPAGALPEVSIGTREIVMSTTITASGPLTRWRTIDLLTCAFLGVAFGGAYWAWGLAY